MKMPCSGPPRPSLLIAAILVLFFMRTAAGSREEGAPLVRNFDNQVYRAQSQNWCALQDRRGVMYFGNSNGVLQFDGHTWHHVMVANRSIVRSLSMDERGVIYCGAIGEVGYLRCDEKGVVAYHSLMEHVPEGVRNFSDVWSVVASLQGVYFISTETILRWHEGKMHVIPVNGGFKSYQVSGRIFIPHRTRGLLELRENELLPLPEGEQFQRSRAGISVVFPYGPEQLLLANRTGFFIYDLARAKAGLPEVVRPLNSEMMAYLGQKQAFPYSGIPLSNGWYAMGTIGAGVLIFDRDGRLQQVVNKRLGLADDLVAGFCQDSRGHLWIATNNGISLMEFNSPLTTFDQRNGLAQNVMCYYRHQGKLYVGGFAGIHQVVWDPAEYMAVCQPVPGSPPYECWDLQSIRNVLLAGMADGLYQVTADGVRLISRSATIYALGATPRWPRHVFIGMMEGLACVELEYSAVSGRNPLVRAVRTVRIPDVPGPVRSIVPDEKGDLWVSSEFSGIYRLIFPAEGMDFSCSAQVYGLAEGLPSLIQNYLYRTEKDLLAATGNGIYRLIPPDRTGMKGRFVPDSFFAKHLTKEFLRIAQLSQDKYGNYWLLGESQVGLLKALPDGQFQLISGPFQPLAGELQRIYPDPGGIVWLGANQKLFRIDQGKQAANPPEFRVLIRQVTAGQEKVQCGGLYLRQHPVMAVPGSKVPLPDWPELPYQRNSLVIEFAAPHLQASGVNQYRYQLDGFRPEWTEWDPDRRAVYTNLPEGEYRFNVQCRDVYQNVSSISYFQFTIRPPWYRTIWAFGAYGFMFLSILYTGIRLNSRRLKLINLRLEKLVQERTAKVLEQAEELKKLSIVASETDNAVIIMDAEGNFEWVNEGFHRLYGLTVQELILKRGNNLATASSNPAVAGLLEECVREKHSVIYQTSLHTSGGELRWSQTTLTPILDAEGKVSRLVAIDSDITKQKLAEDQIRQQNEKISAQKEQLEHINLRLTETNQQLTEVNVKLEDLATHDGMTGIANHRRFQEFLQMEWRRATRYSRPLTLILLDVDYFKRYNDRYGHQAGDECLRKIARTLAGTVQRSNDLVARYGGEEFAAVLSETSQEGAAVVAERIRQAVEALEIPHEDSSIAAQVTVSLGAAVLLPGSVRDPSGMVKAADDALYRSKQEGRNRVSVTALLK